jgi:hypothetical protein
MAIGLYAVTITSHPVLFEVHSRKILLVPLEMLTKVTLSSDARVNESVLYDYVELNNVTSCHNHPQSTNNRLCAVRCGGSNTKMGL